MSSTQEAGNLYGPGPAHAMMRSPTVLIASVGLWGMNIYFFRVFGIDYVRVLNLDLWKLEGSNDATKKDIDYGDHSTRSVSEYNADDLDYSMDEDANMIMEQGAAGMDPPAAITWNRLVSLSLSLLILLHTTYFFWIDVAGGGPVGSVFAFYFVVLGAILFPHPALLWLRKSTVLVLQRTFELFNPRCSYLSDAATIPSNNTGIHHSPMHQRATPKPVALPVIIPRIIPFVDVFFADALCSLSKVFFDWGILLHMAANPTLTHATPQTILIPSAFAAVPYVIRARQCLVMYTVGRLQNDPKRYNHLMNALKYSTSIFPLCLSAYSKTFSEDPNHDKDRFELYLIILLVINSCYAFYWDVVMDWGMMHNPSTAATVMCSGGTPEGSPRGVGPALSWGHALLRSRLRFGVAISAVILIADAVLRFSWVLRFYSDRLFPNDDSFVLCTQFLEVFRRAIWNLLRVEWENLKHQKEAMTMSNELVASGDGNQEEFSAPSNSSTAILKSTPSTPGKSVSQMRNKATASIQMHDRHKKTDDEMQPFLGGMSVKKRSVPEE